MIFSRCTPRDPLIRIRSPLCSWSRINPVAASESAKNCACEVCEAEDGLVALKKVNECGFDLIITDINMPNMDGLSFISALRRDIQSPVPVIIVTTKGAEEDRDRGLELGANSYLTKPFSSGAVLRAVGNLTQQTV